MEIIEKCDDEANPAIFENIGEVRNMDLGGGVGQATIADVIMVCSVA